MAFTRVEVVPFDPRWHERFVRTREELASVLTDARIEHIGSTSVPGLASKDTIDVAVGVDDVSSALAPATIAALAQLGFEHVPASFAHNDDHGFLHRIVDGHRPDHVHVMRRDSDTYAARILFRDYLRAHPGAAAAYEREKRELAGRFRGERDRYVTEKQGVVEAMMIDARRWAADRREADCGPSLSG
ncbi:GrpB family protein [Georgenia halophila]|uniref:GrpB family protein n=1 Tax=Georgenia halophila TaxID=620889 RepID=A0ABP8LA55_9MICO